MSDNFDSYTLGSIAGQGGWTGWGGNGAIAGTVTTAQAASGSQSVQVVRGNDTVHAFTGVSSGTWSLSVQQYLPSTSSGQTWTILMNQYPNNLNWSAQVLADMSAGLVGVYDGATTQQGSAVTLIKDQWVTIRFDINLNANSVSAYYNNSLMGTFAWQSGGINQLQALDLYPDEGASAQVGPVYYDNVLLQVVPEPTTGSLLLLGSLALLMRSRKQS